MDETHLDLDQEVPEMLFELGDVIVEAEQSLDKHFDLRAKNKE